MYRGIRQEALLAFVQWQRCSPADERPEMQDKGKTCLIDLFKVYQYDDSSIRPVIYDDEECMTRRGIITSLALIRDHDGLVKVKMFTTSFTPNDIFDFILEQLRSHDYVSSPLVYDADEEYIAALLYSLASVQTRAMYECISHLSNSQGENSLGVKQLQQCSEVISSFFSYPSPSFKGAVLVAALYTESVFEMSGRFPVSHIFTHYIDYSYPTYTTCIRTNSLERFGAKLIVVWCVFFFARSKIRRNGFYHSYGF